MSVESEWLSVKLRQQARVGGGFFKAAGGDVDEQVVAFGDDGPEAGVEHPVGRVKGCAHAMGEGEAVAGIVVAAFGVLVDVGGLDDVAVGRFEAVAGDMREMIKAMG